MTDADRLILVQDCLADMREDIRTHAPNHVTDPATFLLAAMKRRALRVVSEDEWEDQFEQGEEDGRMSALNLREVTEAERLVEALSPRFP